MIWWEAPLLSPSQNMLGYKEQARSQPMFSPACASATYGSTRMSRRKNIFHCYDWHFRTEMLLFLFVNSLAPGKSECDFKNSIFNLVSLTGICRTSYANTLRWMPLDLTDGKSTLVQVMAWCRQATSHYLNQCWPRSMSPYGVTKPQWVK